MPYCSLIIPAHNEALVIEKSLAGFDNPACHGEIEVIVACNGCSDDTAARARSVGQWVRVIETEVASKSLALNLGDQAATAFPRFYIDADVVLSVDSLQKVADALIHGGFLAAAPRARLDLSGSSWSVRAYYSIDTRLPWFAEGIGNSGVYALSEAGRRRFQEFPAITTDDGFIRLQFAPQERCTVADAATIVTAPATLAGLIAIKTRSHFGKQEIAHHFPHLLAHAGPSNKLALLRLCRDPRNWPALAVYAYVKFVARFRSRIKYRLNGGNRWERDDSRPVAPSQAAAASQDSV